MGEWKDVSFFEDEDPIRSDGESTVWLEKIDGHVYLAVGDDAACDARYIPWDEVASLRHEAEKMVDEICDEVSDIGRDALRKARERK